MQTAGSLRIETFEGSRPGFGGAIVYWVLNRDHDTRCGKRATRSLIDRIAVGIRERIAIALPNRSTRKRLPLCGFVLAA